MSESFHLSAFATTSSIVSGAVSAESAHALAGDAAAGSAASVMRRRVWLRRSAAAFALGAVIFFAAGPAFARPPEGEQIDPAVHEWFEALVRADGTHCCGQADCRVASPNEVRAKGDKFEILLNGDWQDVPDSLVVHRESGPFAATIVCKSHFNDAQLLDVLWCVIPYAGG